MEQVSEYRKNIAKTTFTIGMVAALSGGTVLLHDKIGHPKLSKQTIKYLNSKIDDAFISSSLANKGVTLHRIPENYKYKLSEKVKFPLSESFLKKYMASQSFFKRMIMVYFF